MDSVGFIIIAICSVSYLVFRKTNNRSLQTFSVLGLGFGIGIVVGVMWAYSIFMSAFSKYGF